MFSIGIMEIIILLGIGLFILAGLAVLFFVVRAAARSGKSRLSEPQVVALTVAQHGFYAKPRLRPWSIVWFADSFALLSRFGLQRHGHPRFLFKSRTFGMIFVTLTSSASLWTGVVKTFRCTD